MYKKIYPIENLLVAYLKARKGKTQKHYVIKFEKKLQSNLLKLSEELHLQTYQPRPLKTFIVKDPKTRKISKSKFRDRIIHHALINVIGNLFQKSFIYDSHANQIGKGTLKAIERFDLFKRKVSKNNTRKCYVLKADIKHYFEEVDHSILFSIIGRKITDEKVLWLISKILSNGSLAEAGGGERTRGMPLGSHTSQFFANLYLNELDQFVKHELKVKYYIRYVDDFVILSSSKLELIEYRGKIDEFLRNKLKLTLHPDKTKICLLDRGVTFLGFRIFYYHKIPKKSNYNKFESKFKELKVLYREKQISREKVIEALEGWMAYANHGNTYRYRRNLLRQFNRHFPIYNKSQIIKSKKNTNFFRKVYASKVEFSVQKTLALVHKGLNVIEIAKFRGFKEGTVWSHFENLIEHGQLAVWKIMPKRKIVKILQNIRNSSESLTHIKMRFLSKKITFNEIACVRAHLKMKEKIKNKIS